jgi:hypothetical protein
MTRLAIAFLLACTMGCGDDRSAPTSGASQAGSASVAVPGDAPQVEGSQGTVAPGEPAAVAAISVAATKTYLSEVVQPVVGRVLSVDERARIDAEAGAAIAPVVKTWVREPGFVKSVRRFMEIGLQVSGQKSDVDFDLPGNLVEHVLVSGRPWSEILTSATCYDAQLQERPCDTGAPFGAGVLATRAYLIARASRFNLTRSSALMKNFACQVYPQEETLQPRIERTRLIPMFQAETPEQQSDDRARSGFGNGFACYGCHGQFSLHAQLYVKFDSVGRYVASADGQQDPQGELGRSLAGLMASHLINPTEAASERSNMFGKDVANLAEAARVVAEQSTFVPCAARRYLDFVLAVPFDTIDYQPELFEQVAASAGPDPQFGQIAEALLTHPVVIQSIASSLGAAP